MKKCPKCKQAFDKSWMVCLYCGGILLSDDGRLDKTAEELHLAGNPIESPSSKVFGKLIGGIFSIPIYLIMGVIFISIPIFILYLIFKVIKFLWVNA